MCDEDIVTCTEKPKKQCLIAENPCKICLEEVTIRNGLCCKGACQAWVHYECLNYTPGKIQDIQNNKIIINCPCPDCVTTAPREVMVSTPYTCTNILCPANSPPACKNYDCQANELSRQLPAPCPPPGSLRECGSSRCLDYCVPMDCLFNNTLLLAKRDESLQVGGDIGEQCDEEVMQPAPKVARNVGPSDDDEMCPPRENAVTIDTVNKLIYVVRDLAGQVNALLGSLRER